MSSQDHQELEIVEPIHNQSLESADQPPIDTKEVEPNIIPIELENQPNQDPQNHIHTITQETYQKPKQEQPKPEEKGSSQKMSRLSSRSKKARKLVLYKCKVCKTQGKKYEVRMCTKCKFYFHKDCMDPNKVLQESKAFVCQLCQRPIQAVHKNEKNQTKSSEKQVNQSKDNKNSLDTQGQKEKSSGFLNISKLLNIYRVNFKKEEWKRKLYEFYKRYPYCFQKNRVVFPIEDHLLHIYQSIFPSYCKTTTPRPIPSFDASPVPKDHYNDLFQIQVFFMNFWEDFRAYNFFKPSGPKEEKEYKAEDFTRAKLYKGLFQEGMTELYAWMLEFLLRMYLNDIMDRNRIDNMKYISSNPFFNLLATINENQGLKKDFIIKLAPQIIKNITKIPSFKRSFQCEFGGQQLHQLSYPKRLTLESKIQIITKLIRGLCDTDCFKEIVVKKSQMISQLTKEKGETLLAQKAIENENLPLRQKIKQLQKQLKQLAFSDPKEYAKKYEQNHKKLQKLAMTHKQNAANIEEHKEKIKQIARKMPFVNSVIKFLGVDRFKSEYFFYKNQKDRIYIKYRESLLSEETDDTFMVYVTKEQIQQLKAWLNAKGTNERSLVFNITNLEQKDLLHFESSTNQKTNIVEELAQNMLNQAHLQSLESINRDQIVEMLMFCENMYKETLYSQETVQQREIEFSDIYFKLTFEKKLNGIKKSELQKKEQHRLRVLFDKYPSKLWNWNEKVKKFWFEFLDFCTTDPIYQTEGNLIILATVWKITIKIYHIQSLRKKQKHEKKRLKGKQQQLLIQEEIQPNSSPDQIQTPESEFNANRRRLRKRQGTIDFKENHEQSPNESLQTSSKKDSSSPEDSAKTSTVPQTKQKNGPNKAQKTETKKSKTKASKNASKKLSIEPGPSESNSESEYSSYEEQSQKASSKPKAQKTQQEENSEANSDKKSLKQEIFCEECFENVNYDKPTKNKLIKCLSCSKVYHKKCMDEDDFARFKAFPNDWKCDDCQRKFEIDKHKNSLMLKNDISLEEGKKKDNKIKQKDLKLVQETLKGSGLQSKTTNEKVKVSKVKQKVKEVIPNKNSKKIQKAQKKERKKIEEESKAQQTEENSESDEEERKVEKLSKKVKGRPKKIEQKQKKAIGKEDKENKTEMQTAKSKKAQKINTSISSGQRGSKRQKKSRKKIVEESSDEYLQPNSEQEESASI